MPATISLENVSKKYRVFDRSRDRVAEGLSLGRMRRGRDFWALRDIDLTVEKGVSLGLLGRNGAGKSTLLQLVAGVLQPTSGVVTTRGRISALLQLGAGFNPEFTGRENALMNGLLLGIGRKEMLSRFDEIEEFADIGDFINQPVKSYSSGMRARLGFAVAVNVEPEILLVDETLSVGDGVFKQMGIQKMRDLRDSGATIVFVSHSTTMIKNFCTEAALLQKGRLLAHGSTSETADLYQAVLSNEAANRGFGLEKGEEPQFHEDPELLRRGERLRHGSGEARIQGVEVLDASGVPAHEVQAEDRATIRVHVEYSRPVADGVVGITLRDKAGLDIFSTSTKLENVPLGRRKGGERVIVDFAFEPSLQNGPYSVAAFVSPQRRGAAYYDWVDVAAAFEIGRPLGRPGFAGLVHLPTKVEVFEPSARETVDQRDSRPA